MKWVEGSGFLESGVSKLHCRRGTQWKKKIWIWSKNERKMSKRSQEDGWRICAIIGAVAPGQWAKIQNK
ncbi:hypothetical protein H6P81_002909 [Aristolochia fimbriata]|uniref:Uncharacterized protein n=1 Tax=Aristolochia fimbriata TaxID=158543 RepID=A0AAV7FEY2_ARIFI|nr:hypothetical protein H6P81_002909 [Aristolochia fimbriata]